MWYTELINENDGIESILSLFETEEEFINHYFSNILFFNVQDVEKQANKLSEKIGNQIKVPVRFSTKSEQLFYSLDENNQKNYKKFRTRKEAHVFSCEHNLFHNESDVKVITDKDGNYSVRNEICYYTGYRISQGAISDFKNYTISHIWANTSNPYFFTSLWNISIIPQTFSFILDKSKGSSSLIKKVKIITEILHFKLYKPNSILNNNIISDENNFENDYEAFIEECRIANSFIENKQIKFFKQKEEHNIVTNHDLSDITTEIKLIVENKNFIFKFLEKLKEIGFQNFDIFTFAEKTKDICRLSYPILVDVTGASDEIILQKSRPVNSDVYYKKPIFNWNDKQFIICNDWKPINRKLLMSWLIDRNG